MYFYKKQNVQKTNSWTLADILFLFAGDMGEISEENVSWE
jgi:hypothetical protein